MSDEAGSPVMVIGDARLQRVEELRIPNSIAYFTTDADLIAANRDWLSPHFLDDDEGFDLVFQSWIFEADGRVVLVDPCTGNGKPHVVPFFDQLDVPYIERMATTGYRPEDIDIVVCTHLHHDHCGWNTQLRDGKWVPTFPNARYIMRRSEYERWGPKSAQHPVFDYNEGVFERSIQPVVEAGLAELISGSHRLTTGMLVEPAPGHTLGHQMLHLTSSGHEAYFTGDCFHHPIQLVDPTIPFGDAEDLDQVIAMRRKLAGLSADRGALLIPAHLPFPHAVRAFRDGDAIRFAAAGAV
ncbi:MAG: MBL fold metallo-hydrolase [Novosphingobium sp.]|nr:MBL fold metallo-hydrolase [Novosphingobium sp.]